MWLWTMPLWGFSAEIKPTKGRDTPKMIEETNHLKFCPTGIATINWSNVMNHIFYCKRAQSNTGASLRDNQLYLGILLMNKLTFRDRKNDQSQKASTAVSLIMQVLQEKTRSNTIEIID